jgi:hypothetical protein
MANLKMYPRFQFMRVGPANSIPDSGYVFNYSLVGVVCFAPEEFSA